MYSLRVCECVCECVGISSKSAASTAVTAAWAEAAAARGRVGCLLRYFAGRGVGSSVGSAVRVMLSRFYKLNTNKNC